MSDLFRLNENEFYIELKQERYYFPGDNITGDIILYLKKHTKTNNIKVTLEGYAEIGGKTAVICSKSTLVAEPPAGEKSYFLEARTHRFPFKIRIPTAEEKKLPSTLLIPKLLKVKYKIIAVHNRPFMIMEKLCPTATSVITILEKINVESEVYKGGYSETREFSLTGEDKKVKVVSSLEKRAAVKGDTIPITVTIHHTGNTTKKNGIQAQLLRYVHYGKNKKEVFGPKILAETVSDIDITDDSFIKSFHLNLIAPKTSLCPTVDTSCDVFQIEYIVRVKTNLNQEGRFKIDRANDIVHFNIPIIIGTFPKYKFSIDDEEDDLLIQKTEDPSDYNQVFEKMKELEIYESAPSTPVSLESHTTDSSIAEIPVQFQKPNEYSDIDERPMRFSRNIKPLPKVQEITEPISLEEPHMVYSPINTTQRNSFRNTTENMTSHRITVISPPLESLNPSTKVEIEKCLPTVPVIPASKSILLKRRISTAPPPVPTPSSQVSPPPLPPRRQAIPVYKPLPTPPALPSRPVGFSSTPILPTMTSNTISYEPVNYYYSNPPLELPTSSSFSSSGRMSMPHNSVVPHHTLYPQGYPYAVYHNHASPYNQPFRNNEQINYRAYSSYN